MKFFIKKTVLVLIGTLINIHAYADQTVSYTYNAAGQVLTEDGARTDVNDISTYTYDAQGNKATFTNALGQQIKYTAYDEVGHLLSMTDANGIITQFTYNDRGWLLTSTIKHPTNSALNSVTSYSYDVVGQIISMTLPNSYQLSFEYDGARRLTAIKNPSNERIEYTLDTAGNRTQQVIKNNAGTITYSVAKAFDELSRVMAVTGNNGQNFQHRYDVNDNETAAIDGRNNKTQQTYDALNRVVKVIDPNLKEIKFTYDSQNRIKTVTDARGNTTTYNYDGFGNVLSQISPDTGTTTFTYDSAGNRISATDARSVVVNYTYDALNRLVFVSYPAASSESITYTYDNTANGNYGVGHLTGVKNGTSTITYTYNYLGLMTQKRAVTNGISSTTSYNYDLAGNLLSITYPSGRIVSYVRDNFGRVQSIGTKLNAQALQQSVMSGITYLPFGPVNYYSIGNGLSFNASYDMDYRLTHIQVGGVLSRGYSYDPADNILSITNNLDIIKNQQFTYDQLNHLTSSNGIYGYQAFSYDAVGNRTGFLADDGTGIQNDTYNYDATSNRLLNINKTKAGIANWLRIFNYDANGNIVNGINDNNDAITYSYNKANLLFSAVNGATTASYFFDALGQRVSKNIGTSIGGAENYHYDETGQLIAVTNSGGVPLREYIYNDTMLVGFVKNGVLYYVNNDHQNTPQVVTAQNQSVVWMADYQPFGKLMPNQTNSIELYSRFPGQYVDQETGNYYNYLRDYDPSIGRYIESDPIGLRGGINTYAYVKGNPIKYIDPNGLEVTVYGRPTNLQGPFGFVNKSGVDHWWFKTDTKEGGMGPDNGQVPGQEGGGDLPFSPTVVVDHTGESQLPGAHVVPYNGPPLDEQCVNDHLKVGTPTGPFVPFVNDCHIFVNDVIRACRMLPSQ